MNRKTIYGAVFIIATFAGVVTADASAYRMTNGCVSINVPAAIYHDALDAGLFEWMDMQCGVTS